MPNNTENSLASRVMNASYNDLRDAMDSSMASSGLVGGTVVNRNEYPDLAPTLNNLEVVYSSPPSGWVAFDEAVDMANDSNGAIYQALVARRAADVARRDSQRAEAMAQIELMESYNHSNSGPFRVREGSTYGGSTTIDRGGLTVSDRMGNTRVQMGSSISARSGGASGGSTSLAGYGSFQLSQAARDAAENQIYHHLMEQFHSNRIRNVDDEFDRIYEQERELQLRRGLENALRTPREVEIITDDTFASMINTGTAYITNANLSSRIVSDRLMMQAQAQLQETFARGFS